MKAMRKIIKLHKIFPKIFLTSSLRAKRGNLFTSIHSLYLAQSSRHTAHGVFALLFIFVMLIQSGCSLFGYYKIERYLGTNSICWEDNDHILIYASIAEYSITQDPIGGEEKHYNWTGGEIWRITASTGVKELLFREKGAKYWAWDNTTGMRIDAINGNIYICDVLFTYKVRDDFSEWDSIGYFTLPIISEDEKTMIAYDTEEYSTVKKYNLENNTSEDLYVNDVLIEWLDYDYERNYLLINSNKFVDLNTGEEEIVHQVGDTIDGNYIVDVNYIENGRILDNYITIDSGVYKDIAGDSLVYYIGQLRISINDITEKHFDPKITGTINSSRDKYAYYSHSKIIITDTLGNEISEAVFSDTEL